MHRVKYLWGTLLYLAMLPLALPAAVVIPLGTRAQFDPARKYTWGGWFGTYDNPPQGDEGYVTKRAPYPNVVTGFKGYINRVQWMRRNRLYGLKRKLSVEFKPGSTILLKGNPDISDKYKVPGTLRATAVDSQGRPYAFEYYKVWPYSKTRCVRIRLGWKIKGRKFTQPGDFAPLVFTINPFDGYGND